MALQPLLLCIGKVWPEPQSSAAGSRMMQLLDLFQEQKFEVVFACSAQRSAHSADLSDRNIREHKIKMNDSSFDAWIAELQPDIVLFDRFMTEEQFGWRIAEQCPEAMRILDTEDLHALRQGRHQAFKEGRNLRNSDLINEIAKREVASIYRCDLSLMISQKEMDVLRDIYQVPQQLLFRLPFMLDPITEKDQASWAPYEERADFVTIGNFRHAPNWDSVRYLKDTIWPLIREQLPQAQLHVYGAYPSDKVFQLHNPKQGFLVKGRAENAEEIMQNARVCLAPLRFGAGLKGKLITAMQSGTPSVTTHIGAECMHGDLPWAGTIADEPTSFAEAAVTLYSKRSEWAFAQQCGATIINKQYDQVVWKENVWKRMDEISNRLSEHRQKNFTGQMLMHHSMASTKFMSRWIEAKNRA